MKVKILTLATLRYLILYIITANAHIVLPRIGRMKYKKKGIIPNLVYKNNV
eukprot:COSAG05_NODE_38_length_27626_cov_78.614306_2_plen_51_part_00